MEKIGSREDGLPNVCACVCVGHRRVFFALFFCFEPLVLDKQLMGGRRRPRSTCPLCQKKKKKEKRKKKKEKEISKEKETNNELGPTSITRPEN